MFRRMSAQAFTAMAELAASLHGVSSRTQAAALGLSPRQIESAKRDGWLSEPARGALVINGHPRTWHQRLAVVATAREKSQLRVSFRAAARQHGLDGCTEELLEFSRHRSRPFRPIPGMDVVVHVNSIDIPRCDLIQINGLWTTGLARTLAELGSVISEDALWKALISARRLHRVSPIWLNRTAVRLHRPGQAGTGVLLRALRRWASEGNLPDTWFEELIARLLQDPRIPPLVRQYEIRDDRGRFVARPDLAIPSLRLGIEAHSRQFHFEAQFGEADEDRDLRAAAVGWELSYLGWFAQRRPAQIVELVAQICDQRRRELFTL